MRTRHYTVAGKRDAMTYVTNAAIRFSAVGYQLSVIRRESWTRAAAIAVSQTYLALSF